MKFGNIYIYYMVGNQSLGEELPLIAVLISAFLALGVIVTFYLFR